MMCRDAAIFLLNEILDDIHNGVEPEKIREKSNLFIIKYDYEQLGIRKEEIRLDRLLDYIKFFNISYVCEYDIFPNPEMFYNILKENLQKEKWEDIKNFLDRGNILCDYQVWGNTIAG